MLYGVKYFFEVNKYYSNGTTFIHFKIPVICEIKQAINDRVPRSKLKLRGKMKFVSVKVVIKLIIDHLFENPANKR